MAVFGFDRVTAMRLKRKGRLRSEGGVGGKATLLNKKQGRVRYFKLLEDMEGTTSAYAQNSDKTGASLGGHVLVHQWAGLLEGAKAGYFGQFVLIDGTWDFQQGPCIGVCETVDPAYITVGNPPDGVVDEAYAGHTVSGTGLSYPIEITGLPPGLTETGGAISGTPTTAGTYYAVATGSAPAVGGGTCAFTKIVVITITEAEEE